MILLGAVIGMIVPLSKRVADQRRSAEARRTALIDLSNTLEQLVADRNQWPTAGEERELPLSEDVARRLRKPRLVATSTPLEGPPTGWRFDVTLTWERFDGGRSAPLRLSAFAFANEGDAP